VTSGTLAIRKVRLAQGERVGGHAHHFDHTTIFLRGRVTIMTYDPRCECRHEYVADPGSHLLIDAAVIHDLTALDEGGAEFWCVFSHASAVTDPPSTGTV
jgi:quercetin dioxygenase-like cupin family protein